MFIVNHFSVVYNTSLENALIVLISVIDYATLEDLFYSFLIVYGNWLLMNYVLRLLDILHNMVSLQTLTLWHL